MFAPLSPSVVLFPSTFLLCAPPPLVTTPGLLPPLSSPVPRLIISVCVFSQCFPFTPCLVIACIYLPLRMLTFTSLFLLLFLFLFLFLFLSCPSSPPHVLWILVLAFLPFWFVLCPFVCALFSLFCYFVLLLCCYFGFCPEFISVPCSLGFFLCVCCHQLWFNEARFLFLPFPASCPVTAAFGSTFPFHSLPL